MASSSKSNFDFALRLVLSILASFALSFGTAFGATSDLNGWELRQRHKQLGENSVYLTHDAVKIVNKTLGFTILLGPPYKSIAIFRPDDHVIYTSPPADFQKTSFLPAIIATKPFKYSKLIKFGEEDFHGLHVEKFCSRTSSGDQIWTISNIDLAQNVLAVVHTYYQIDNPLLPFRKINQFGSNKSDHLNLWLSVSINDGYQGKTTFLDTVGARKLKLTPQDFAYPVGFKKLNSAGEAFVSRKGASGLNDIVKDLNLGEDLGSSEDSAKKTNVDKAKVTDKK